MSASKAPPVMSMTGFGKGQLQNSSILVEVELRAVNSRFLDLNLKVPREYLQFESDIRKVLQGKLHRGRVEVFVQRTLVGEGTDAVSFNRVVFDSYWSVYETLAKEHDCVDARYRGEAVQSILARRDVLDAGSEIGNTDEESEVLLQAVSKAASSLVVMRKSEGEALAKDLEKRIAEIRSIRSKIAAASTDSVEQYQQRLQERLKNYQAGNSLDESRLFAEATLLADRVDITEELVRIESHCAQWEEVLQTVPQGRKLEFVLQEFGREFNTIASKTQKGAVQALAVDAKSVLEKMREQAANVE